MRIVVQTEHLAKYYQPSKPDQLVLRDLNLQIQEGKFTILMGASGSGKSTLLYLLAGLDRASGGKININGKDISEYSETQLTLFRRANIGLVFQDPNLIEELSIEENILLAGYLVEKDKKLVQKYAHKLMAQLGISQLADRYPSEISGGEGQRVNIARALINQPKLLIADEPTGSLNSAASQKVLQVFKALHKGGNTILLATHDVSSAAFGDVVYYLKDGAMLDQLSLENIPTVEAKKAVILNWLKQNGW